MDSLSSTDLNLEINKKYSDKLFYGKYVYSYTFFCEDLSCIRFPHKEKSLQKMVDDIEAIFERRQRLNLFFNVPSIRSHSYDKLKNQKKEQVLENLIKVAKFFKNNLDSVKLVISGDWGYCYANSLDQIRELVATNAFSSSPFLDQSHVVSKAEVNRPQNTISLKHSQYSHRSYLRDMHLADHEKQSIANFLINQQELRLSPALNRWCYNIANCGYYGYYIRSHYFIDHNGQDILTMMSLIQPGLIRKTLDIIEINN